MEIGRFNYSGDFIERLRVSVPETEEFAAVVVRGKHRNLITTHRGD